MRILSLPVDFVKISIRSKRSPLLVISVVSAMVILLAISISVAKRSSAHGVNSAKKEQQLCCLDEPVALRRMIGTYYNAKGDWESELVFNNQGPNQIVVTPILYSLKGAKFTASPISIGGESIHELDLNDLVLSAGPQFAEGSYEFTYTGHKLEMSGGLKIMNKKKSLIFDEQMSEPGIKFASPRMEAVYALPYKSAQASLILTNTSERQIVVNGDVNTWLNAHETQIIHLKTKDEGAGAVSLNHNGGPGALLAVIHVQESSKGFSAAIGFNDPSKGASNQIHGAGLKIGRSGHDVFTPIIAVRNIGKDASSVTGNIPYTTNGKTDRIRLSELSLSPGEVGFLVAPIQWRQISAASAGLEVEYSGAPGSVIASVISVSGSGDKVFPLMMKDPEAVASSSGGYPWFAEDDYSSVVYIKNVTDKPQTFVLDVKYRQGMWGSGLKTVPPGETYVFDVKQTRDGQIKGSEGNTIPLDAENGHIYWTIYGTIEKGLIGRSEAVYAYGGMAQTYECQPCPCPASTNSCMLEPPSLIGFPGDSAQLTFLQRTYNCHGAYGSWFPVSVNNFASDNPSVASITSGGFSSALSPGTAHFTASAPAQVNYWNGFGCATQYFNAFASAVCDVQCSIPTGETFMATGWAVEVGWPTAQKWMQTLTPTTTNFAGRLVWETDPGGGSDDCYFNGSAVAENNSCCDPINPDTWSVGSDNRWGPDYVGWQQEGVEYYQVERLSRGLPLPCRATLPQRMVINCGTLGDSRSYVTNTLVLEIDVTYATSGRNGQFVTREWP